MVPGVEFEDVVCGGEIAGAEFEGIGAFEVVEGVVGEVGEWFWFLRRFWGEGDGGEVWRVVVVWKRHLRLACFQTSCKCISF